VIAVELARAVARAAAAVAVPAGKGKRAGQPVHPRQISFTAARRAIIATTRAGTATASPPAPAVAASCGRVLADLARRRVDVDRHRHHDRKTKARLGFPAAARASQPRPRSHRSASASRSPPSPSSPPAALAACHLTYSPARGTGRHPERQPGNRHARPQRSLSVEHPDGRIRQRHDIPAHLITPNYTALG